MSRRPGLPSIISGGGRLTVSRRTKSCPPKREKYFTTGRLVREEGLQAVEGELSKAFQVPLEPGSPEEVKRFWEEEKNKKRKERQAGLPDRHTHKSRLSNIWKTERLFVGDEGELPGRSITEDVDPDFFTIVCGRPIKEKKNRADYLQDIRECFLTRLKIGYCQDQILLMDERHRLEKKELDRVSRTFHSCLKAFESFLEEDHLASRTLLETAQEEEKKSREKLEAIARLKEELKDVRAGVLVAEEKWRNARMFQKFLYMIAPSEWRREHDPYFGGKDVGDTAADPCLFDREFPGDGKIDSGPETSQLEEEWRARRPPALYFTDPLQLRDVFSDLERNNLRALAQCKELEFPVEAAAAGLEKVKRQFEEDQKWLEEEIRFARDSVEAEEHKWRASERELRRVVFGLFRDLITSEEYLTVTAYVEDVYEEAVGPNDGDLDPVAMIKEIGLKLEDLLLALDVLPNDVVTRTARQFYREQSRSLREAREAERKVRLMETLLKRLSKSLEPPRRGARERKMVARSLPPEEFTRKFEMPKVLPKEERDRLFFYGKPPEDVQLYKPLWA